jgi:hypothetical protein
MMNCNLTNFCMETKYSVFYTHLCTLFGLFGFILCSMSIIVFSSSNFKEKLYKYLKMESTFMALNLLIQIFRPIAYCDPFCQISRSYISNLYVYIAIVYLASIFEMSAFFFNILAASHLLSLMSPENKLAKYLQFEISHRLMVIFIVGFSASLFSFQLFQFKIVPACYLLNYYNLTSISELASANLYAIECTAFHSSRTKFYLEKVSMSIRDGIGMMVMIILNILLLIKFKMNIKKKQYMLKSKSNLTDQQKKQQNSTAYSQNNNSPNNFNEPLHSIAENKMNGETVVRAKKKQINNVEHRMTVMVIVNCSNCIFGRMPVFLFFILHNFIENGRVNEIFFSIACVAIYASYSFSFFLFYLNNKRFRKAFKQIALLNVYRSGQ